MVHYVDGVGESVVLRQVGGAVSFVAAEGTVPEGVVTSTVKNVDGRILI
jgi:hypothetical protein